MTTGEVNSRNALPVSNPSDSLHTFPVCEKCDGDTAVVSFAGDGEGVLHRKVSNRFSALAESKDSSKPVCPYFSDEEFSDCG